MANLKIEKFVGETHNTTIKVPLLMLRVATKLLPKKTLTALEAKGIDVKQIFQAETSGGTYRKAIEVRERGINKKIILSVG